MKKNKIYTIVLLTLLSTLSCKKIDFEDTNVNPNFPSEASAVSLLAGGQRGFRSIYGPASARPFLYVQYIANAAYQDASLYQAQRFDYANYYGYLTDLNKVISLNTDVKTKGEAGVFGDNSNQIAVAKLMKAYYFHFMTDNWGMLPYKTANLGDEVAFNEFDTQESIYDSLFVEIQEALALMEFSKQGPKGDILFGGDMSKWKVFGNTLMMNMALRLSKKDPAKGKKFYLIAEAGGVIDSNSDNIYFQFTTEYDNPWYDSFVTRNREDQILSKPFVDKLIGTGSNTAPEDPRLEKYGQLSEKLNIYVGGNYGKKNPKVKNFSFISKDILYTATTKAPIYTYAQTLLNKAEAAELNWTSVKTAEEFTKEGIKASMEQWGVESSKITTYVDARPSFDGLKTIAYQKWVALFLQGAECWFDWRKHGVNQVPLVKPSDSKTEGIPNRQAYPLSAIGSNKENYEKAVAAQGPDNLDTKVWWAK